MTADWLASAPEVCPYLANTEKPVPSFDAENRATGQAAGIGERLVRLGFRSSSRPLQARRFSQLFPKLPSPRAGQQIVEELLDDLESPSLVLIEDATGTGKTESAFLVVERAMVSLDARGAYVALPTRATSDQTFRRLRDFLSTSYEGAGELHLLHGSAMMSVDYEALRNASPLRVADVHDLDDDGRAGGVHASAWFAKRKRGLLAGFAVGTIDQALLAVLPVKHHALRLAALADRVVVLDEIHAYDTYMSTLLERLLEWLGALDTTVVLLSATLPRLKREELLDAYRRGAGRKPIQHTDDTAYPRVIAVGPEETVARAIPRTTQTRCSFDLVGGGSTERPLSSEVLSAVGDAVAAGGCVAVIMNTVRRAQSAFEQVSEVVDRGQQRLLHAQFRLMERDKIERSVVTDFGPPARSTRPDGAVLVSTQIIEQSLDVDFDLLISDLAPIDLLLQRRGRLHRHDRPRPSELSQTRMLVIAGQRDGLPVIDRSSRRVYDHHILLRTWLTLRSHNGQTVVVPDDVEALIESVYAPADPPDDPAVATAWRQTQERLADAQRADAQRARVVRVPAPGADEPFYARPLSDASDDEASADLRAATRLGDSLAVVILHASESQLVGGPFARTSIQEIRGLLSRVVSFSNPGIVHPLRALDPPERWRDSAFLYNHRLIQLDQADRWATPEGPGRHLALRLDPDLGVVIES